MKRESVDIWCIQEKKLIEKDETPQVQGYTMIRKDRKQARGRESNRGGGVLMGKKEDILCKVVQKEFGGPEDNITGRNDYRNPPKKQPETKDNKYVYTTNKENGTGGGKRKEGRDLHRFVAK